MVRAGELAEKIEDEDFLRVASNANGSLCEPPTGGGVKDAGKRTRSPLQTAQTILLPCADPRWKAGPLARPACFLPSTCLRVSLRRAAHLALEWPDLAPSSTVEFQRSVQTHPPAGSFSFRSSRRNATVLARPLSLCVCYSLQPGLLIVLTVSAVPQFRVRPDENIVIFIGSRTKEIHFGSTCGKYSLLLC